MTPAIVVLAYHRPKALRRLLASMSRAEYPEGIEVQLVVSIDLDLDRGPLWAETLQAAREFQWPYGPKEVIERSEHLGLVGHFWASGSLTHIYGSAILLEDDLVVATSFYAFAVSALGAYGADERVGGSCLYGLWFNGFTGEPFQPLDDGSDVFFLQLPYTQGLCFSARQWDALERWANGDCGAKTANLHPAFGEFGPDEWFPQLAEYFVANGRYVCFPRVSVTIGWGDPGEHFSKSTSWLQTPLPVGPRNYQLRAFEDSLAVYDSFFEVLPGGLRRLAPDLPADDFDVDLNATKSRENLMAELVLTTRPVRHAVAEYGLEMYPPEMNVIWSVPGHGISLARRSDVDWGKWAEIESRRRLHAYNWRRHRPSRRRWMRFVLARMVARVTALRSRTRSR